MSAAREEILGRIRIALADRPTASEVPWSYGQPVGIGTDTAIERFVERTADYRARRKAIAQHLERLIESAQLALDVVMARVDDDALASFLEDER